MRPATKALVRDRANHRCEYRRLHQQDSPLAVLYIEHIIPKKHGGSDDPDNLALACIDCNLHKGANLTGIDPETGEITCLRSLAAVRVGARPSGARWRGVG